MTKFRVTAAGYSALQDELNQTHGGRANSEYHAAQAGQLMNEARIVELEDKLARAEVIDVSKLSGDTIKFGATVTLIDADTEEKKVWRIVGEPEANANSGKISVNSPIARALIGRAKGDAVEVAVPTGVRTYRVQKVEWL
jgi:transcription elongation factor GreA